MPRSTIFFILSRRKQYNHVIVLGTIDRTTTIVWKCTTRRRLCTFVFRWSEQMSQWTLFFFLFPVFLLIATAVANVGSFRLHVAADQLGGTLSSSLCIIVAIIALTVLTFVESWVVSNILLRKCVMFIAVGLYLLIASLVGLFIPAISDPYHIKEIPIVTRVLKRLRSY